MRARCSTFKNASLLAGVDTPSADAHQRLTVFSDEATTLLRRSKLLSCAPEQRLCARAGWWPEATGL